MIKTCLLTTSLALGGCASTNPDVPRPHDHPAYAGVEAANRQLESRLEQGDLAGVAAMYEDDGLMVAAGGNIVAGREALDASWSRPLQNAEWSLSIHSIEGPVELPVQRGTSVLAYDRPTGRHVSEVEFVVVWRLQDDGSYRIAVDAYWSSPDP